MKNTLTNAFIALFLALILIDALPTTSLLHRKLKDSIDPFLDKAGLWQETWNLFAPEVDKVNSRISAEMIYADGTTHTWRCLDWSEVSHHRKFILFRHMEYADKIRMNGNSEAWPAQATYLATNHGHPDKKGKLPETIHLKRHWHVIAHPKEGIIPYDETPSPWEKSYTYYTGTFEP